MNMDKKNNGTRLLALVTIKNKDISKWALRLEKEAFATERQVKDQSEEKWISNTNPKGCIALGVEEA
jgi:hypothetical protein